MRFAPMQDHWLKPIVGLCLVIFTKLACADTNTSAAELGLMQGFPPPATKQITRDNFMLPPNNRWAFQHIRELQPTREVYRGSQPVSSLTTRLQALGHIETSVRDGRKLSLETFLEESHTDGFVILHRGEIVFEQYMNGQQQHTQHQMFSATKSFIGTMMLMLIEEGLVNPTEQVTRYLPELHGSAFGDASVQQVLDMTTGISFTEVYDDPNSEIWRYGWVFNVFGRAPEDYAGPLTAYDYLPSLKKKGEHGYAFHYVTPNTDVLGWIISRVTGQSVTANLEQRIWQKLGVERDGYFWLDKGGTEMSGGGLNITARDAARFGQMIIQGGRYNGQRILSQETVERIFTPGDPEVFTRHYPDDPWYGSVAYAYHDQWWTFNNAHKAVSAIGVHGQYIYLDPKAEMVVIKQSSSPDAEGGENLSNDVDGPLLYQAIAEHLLELER